MENILSNLNMASLIEDYLLPWGINIAMALVILIVGRIVVKIIIAVSHKLLTRAKVEETLINFICSIIGGLLTLFVIIAAIDQLGVDTTSLIAIVGAAGLAVGLALQGSLQNFAAGVMLIIFRPFVNGDYVEAAGTAGTVEKISIFSTIFKTPDNREIIVPNGEIYSGVITNYSARPTRRVDMVFGIGYQDEIDKARDVIQSIINADTRILKDPAPQVAVSELADSSVNFVVRPWVNAADYWDVKFDVTEQVKKAFDKEGISIPFPQMDIHMENVA